MVFGPHHDEQLTIAQNIAIFISFGIDNILHELLQYHVHAVCMYLHFRILQYNASLYLLSTIYCIVGFFRGT